MPPKIGFIGLGEMGKGMAKNLVTRGYDLTVYDVRQVLVKELEQLGAKGASSIEELAAATEVIFSMVRDDAQTQEVMWGKDGVLDVIHKGSAIILTSTVSPSLCQNLAKDAGKKEVGVLDSPVSGAKARAEAGTLTLMVGGEPSLFEKMKPILQAVGTNIFYLGDFGMGQVGKMANNMILFGSMAATTEGFAFAVKAGIPLRTVIEFVKVSTGNTWVAQNWEVFATLKKDHSPTATLNTMYKDLNLALAYAKELNIDLPLCSKMGQIDLWRQVS